MARKPSASAERADYLGWKRGAIAGAVVVAATSEDEALSKARKLVGKDAAVKRIQYRGADYVAPVAAPATVVTPMFHKQPRALRVLTVGDVAGIIAWAASKDVQAQYPKATHLIRACALQFPDASVAQIRAALPQLNPGTVGIQVGRARNQ